MGMTEREARSAGPEERAQHASETGPAPAGSDWRGRRRMSAKRKQSAVLRLLRGEDLELVSRELGVTAATLSGWREAFLAAGEASLASRPADGEALESERLKARLGEMLLERELLAAKIAALEARAPGPLARRRSRPGAGPPRPAAAGPTAWRGGAGSGGRPPPGSIGTAPRHGRPRPR